VSSVSTYETYVDGLMASTFFALNGLVGCGHMSGLVARRICPLALMKSDEQNRYQICEPCQTSNCDLCNCSVDMLADMLAGRAASLRLRGYFGAEDCAGPHYRPGQRHRDAASRLFRQKRAEPAGERAFALAHATQQ